VLTDATQCKPVSSGFTQPSQRAGCINIKNMFIKSTYAESY